MLNDLSRFTRTSILLQMLGPGLVAGVLVGAVVLPPDPRVGRDELVLVGLALLAIPAWAGWHGVTVRRMERRLWAEVVTGSQELVAGAVAGARVPGRVVRGRVRRGLPGFGMAGGRHPAPALGLAATVLGDGPARRVGLLVPAGLVLPAGAPLLVALHPERDEVAVLEDRVSSAEVAAAAGDPRWGGPLPTDRAVVGGWLPLVGCALLGLAVAFALGLGVAGLLAG